MSSGFTADTTMIRKYLLAQLAEEERSEIEQRYFAEEEFFDLVKSVEDDLMDEYAAGSLSGDDQARWREYLACEAGSDARVRFAQALSERMKRGTNAGWWKSGWFGGLSFRALVPALAALVVVAGGLWWWLGRGGRTVEAPVTRPSEVVRVDPVRPPVAPEPAVAPKGSPVFAFALVPGTLRSADRQQVVRFPVNTGTLRVNFTVPRGSSLARGVRVARVRVRNLDTGAVFEAPVRMRAAVPLVASKVPDGDYVATLLGVGGNELLDYSFRVRRR